MKKQILLFFLFGVIFSSYAQIVQITGKVTVSDDGSEIPGVNILVKGKPNLGTQTDAEGGYAIRASKGDILVFSFIGFDTKEVIIENQTIINVSLLSNNSQLDEVIITALGNVEKKRALGYAVQDIKGDRLTVAKSTDVSSSLAGKIAGVQLVGSPSSTFDNASVLIRGVTGLGIVSPIFVVDGTITDQSAVIMDDVENISVLKGPAATALYGQRAANGAVLITTKKGGRKKFSAVELNLGFTMEKLSILPPYQNDYAGGYTSASATQGSSYDAEGFYTFKYNPSIHPSSWASFDGQRMLEYGADESWGPRINGQLYRPYYSWYPGDEFGQLSPLTAQPNNVKDFFRTGRNLNNTISFTKGDEDYNFRFSYNNQDRNLIIRNANRQQHQLSLNGSYDINKLVTVSSNLTYTTSNTKGQPTEGYNLDGLNITQNFNQWFQRQLDMNKMRNYRQPDGSLNSWNIGDPNATGDFAEYSKPQYWDNPWFSMYENYGTQKLNRLVGNVGLTLNLTKDLKWESFARMNTYNNENDFRMASGGLILDSYELSQAYNRELNFETNFKYSKSFGDISVDALLGGNQRKNYYSRVYAKTAGGLSTPNYFDIAASISRPTTTRDYAKKEVNSVYGKLSLGYKELLFLEGTLRNDWSSALPVDANSYLYPSVSTSFVFTELLPKNNILSFGKVRASYASVGSDIDAHSLAIAITNGSYYGSNPSVTIGNELRGGGIRPALTKAYEVGTELRLFKKFNFDFAYYHNNNIDQILSVSVSPASGFSTSQINAGSIVSKGIELSLSTTALKSKNFSWDIMLNWAKNKNKVVALADGLDSYLYATNRYDTRLEHIVGEEWGVYKGRKWQRDENGNVIVGANGIPLYETNQVIGNVLPKWTGGMFNSLRYKSISLSFSIDFQKGGLFYSETRNFNVGAGLSQETVGLNDKGYDWRDFPGSYTLEGGNTGNGGIRIAGVFANGAENNRYIPARSYFYTSLQRDASNVLLDGSYIKLREIRAGYELPSSLMKKLKFAQSANIGVIIQNAYLIWATTKKYGIDASELELFYREGGQLSATRQTGFNLKVTF